MMPVGAVLAVCALRAGAQVAGFLPSKSAFHFDNGHWPSVPNYRVAILGREIGIGNASDGLCGGMIFAVRDLFEAGVPPPADNEPPKPDTPLFNYIVAGLARSFTFANVGRFLDGIQSPTATGNGHRGIAWREVREDWPLVKGDIDAGLLAPLGLVHGEEPPTLGYVTGWQHLAECHQVLAWAYDQVGTAVTVRIYDPNFPGDDQSLSFDTSDPDRSTPVRVSGYADGRFRAFFRETYTYHDPRTPVSCHLAGAQIVFSPGIVPAK